MSNPRPYSRLPLSSVPNIIINSPTKTSEQRREIPSTASKTTLLTTLSTTAPATTTTSASLNTVIPSPPETHIPESSEQHLHSATKPCSATPAITPPRPPRRVFSLQSSSLHSSKATVSAVSPSTSFVSNRSTQRILRSPRSPGYGAALRSRKASSTQTPIIIDSTPPDVDNGTGSDSDGDSEKSTMSTTMSPVIRVSALRPDESTQVTNGNPLADIDPGPEEVMVPLLAPTPRHAGSTTGLQAPSLSRSSSTGSITSVNGNRGILRRIFIDRAGTPSQHLTRPTFPPPSLTSYSPVPHEPMSLLDHVKLNINQAIAFGLSTFFLLGVVIWAMAVEAIYAIPKFLRPNKDPKYAWDNDRYWRREGKKISKEPKDYAQQVGMDIENQTVETEDGYLLRMHRVIDPEAVPRPDGRGGFPILILHGLFQSSGSFVTSEDRSLAFWLAKKGYQVYLGNTRGIFDMGHRSYSRGDPRFWDWTIRDLAMYDLPAMVDHVCQETGYDKIAFMGHSQGNGLAFISLSLGMVPNLGKKLSVFIALAPAVYAGPLTTGFPFTALSRLEWKTWKRFFGVLDFIPLMRYAYDYCPARLFSFTGYIMFAFLFNWTDANWLKRRKNKMFRFTPTPVSSASIFWWCGKGGFADRKCTLDDSLDRWFDGRFPPLSIYHGGRDFLVLCDPLLERLASKEKDVKVIKVTQLDKSEHCDFYWAAEAVEWGYESFVDDIESTRPRYPEEMEA